MTAKPFAVYNKATGEIRGRVRVDKDSAEKNLREGEGLFELESMSAVSEAEHYIKDGEVVARPEMDLQVSSLEILEDEELVISNIPPGCTVYYSEGEAVVGDGEIRWSAADDGRFNFIFECFPYKEQEVWVAVKEA